MRYSNADIILIVETSEKIIKKHQIKIIDFYGLNAKKNRYIADGKIIFKEDIINLIKNNLPNGIYYQVVNLIFKQINHDLNILKY